MGVSTMTENNNANGGDATFDFVDINNGMEDEQREAWIRKYQDMMNDLPKGWSKNSKFNVDSGEAPYIDPSGKASWKNPNTKIVMKAISEQQNQSVDKSKMTMVKKLRLMLQAGAPLQAVKIRATIEKVDMNLVLQQEQVTENGYDATSPNNKKDKKMLDMVSPVLLKKYTRMRKMGVGLAQVQQLAFVEAQLQPEQVVELLALDEKKGAEESGNGSTTNDTTPSSNKTDLAIGVRSRVATSKTPSKYAKYKRMLKAGLPMAAIYRSAELDGVMESLSTQDLDIALGIATSEPSAAKKMEEDSQKENKENMDVQDTLNNSDGMKATRENPTNSSRISNNKYFTVLGLNKVSLNDGNSTLAALVRKMAHSVDKTSRGVSDGTNATLIVDSLTLYHALGSFQGVQVARDNYNLICSNIIDEHTHRRSIVWMKAKRQPFQEIARSIGLKLPNDLITRVDIPGLDELIVFIQNRYANDIQDIRCLLDQGFYDFDSLAVMYEPGSRVVAKNAGGGGVDLLCKVAWNRYQQGKTIMGQPTKYFQVCLEYVVAVGANKATIAECVEGMEMFEGRRSLLGGLLQFVPWSAYDIERQESLLDRYRHRGNIYNEVALNVSEDVAVASKSYCYKQYQQGCFFLKRGGGAGTLVGGGGNPSTALATGGRIIIDNRGAIDYGHSLSIGYDSMITGINYRLKEYKLQLRSDAQKHDGHHNSGDRRNNHYHHASDDKDDGTDMVLFDCIPDDYLEFVWPYVVGFSLSAKAWGDCLVDGLEDIEFSEDVFDKLVIPEKRKRLVKALVKNSAARNGGGGFQDLVAGKGEGTVFLLYGPPGVGKTLTAEAVAEVLKRPLFSVSMGTLGTTADELEKRLGEILKLSAKWDAIILLDEADSFLETRSSTSSLERNAMVSVMLKLVEYFSGILFLTSNRFDSLDPAFQTRITLSLEYENLTLDGRDKVWENLLNKSGISMHHIDTEELAKFPLNGREIKNALRLALALASEENCELTHDILVETAGMIKPVGKSDVGKESNCFSLFGW